MRIDISAVVKTAGTELEICETGIIDDLKDVFGIISVTGPVSFQGVLNNVSGLLNLMGEATCTYETECDYCTETISRTIQVSINEELAEEQPEKENMANADQFTYRGNLLVLDKILSDNITLAFPMHHRCRKDCAIVCPKCGEPVTGSGCGCDPKQPVDPRLAALQDFVEHPHVR